METLHHPAERTRPGLLSLLAASGRVAARNPIWRLAIVLLGIDLAFALIEVAVVATDYGFRGAYRLSLQTELGVAQVFGLAQLGTAAFLLWTAWRRFAAPPAATWACVLTYVAIDDAWAVHERLGSFLVERMDLGAVFGLRPQDIGELLAYAVIGTIALGALIITEREAGESPPSTLTMLMVPLVGLLVFFAVVVDVVGGIVMPDVVGIAFEDGGELVAMTLIPVGAWVWVERPDELAAEL